MRRSFAVGLAMILALGLTVTFFPMSSSAGPSGTSEIVVFVRGRLGTEDMRLAINNRVVATWDGLSTKSEGYSYTVTEETVINSLRVSIAGPGWPESLIVDRVEIDGVTYEATSPNTESEGSWNQTTGCTPGFKQSQWLQCHNGWLDFGDTHGVLLAEGGDIRTLFPTEVALHARGRMGNEEMQLHINGETVANWNDLSTTFEPYVYAVTEDTQIQSLKVSIVDGGWGQSLILDRVEIDGVVYETESPNTESNGSWNAATGCSHGFKSSEWLQCGNGWFELTDTHGLNLSAGQVTSPPPTTTPLPTTTTPPSSTVPPSTNPSSTAPPSTASPTTTEAPATTATPTTPPPSLAGAPVVIFDTDLGPDTDDVMALAMVHAYEKQGDAEIAAVTISRNSDTAARFADIVNTFYGRPDIPIGVYRGSTPQDTNDYFYTADLVAAGIYPHDVHNSNIAEGYKVMRQALVDAPDKSVVIIQVGFSTNTAALLQSGPDEISPLSGAQLVEEKVKLLSVMAGRNDSASVEFNVGEHVSSAQKVFADWPVELIQSDGNLGQEILYPLASVLNDFNYVANHPVSQAYLNKNLGWHQPEGDRYNMRSWDLTSVIAALEDPADYFAVTGQGTVTLDALGRSTFTPDANGLHRSLGRHWELSEAQKQTIVNRSIVMATEAP